MSVARPLVAQTGLQLININDPNISPRRDPAHVLACLARHTTPVRQMSWQGRQRPEEYDLLVVAENRADNRPLAALAADVIPIDATICLYIDPIFAPADTAWALLPKLLATSLRLAARIGPVPTVITACLDHAVGYRALRNLAAEFASAAPGVVHYPDPSMVVNFRAAALARQLAPVICPNHALMLATGALLGARASHGVTAIAPTVSAGHTPIDAMFARHVGPVDQLLSLIDLQSLSGQRILDIAQRIRRRRTRDIA